MAARPVPRRALLMCTTLANHSKHRIETMIAAAENALENNVRLTARERAHYAKAIEVGHDMHALFHKISQLKVPPPPPETPRKAGRPSQKEVEAAAAAIRP